MARTRKLGSLIVILLLSSCITPHREKEMRKDIYDLQTRLLEIERQTDATTQASQSDDGDAKKRLASMITNIERLTQDVQRINGDLDTLRVGVRTGRLPSDSNDDESVASKIGSLEMRLETIQEQQANILAALENISTAGTGSSPSNSSKGRNRQPITTLNGLQQAFDRQQFLYIELDAPSIIKSLSKSQERERANFLYAESLYKLGKLREAALRFNEFIDGKPSDRHLPHAQLRMGDCFRHLGDPGTAKLYYEELIEKFPKSESAETAQKRLEDLS